MLNAKNAIDNALRAALPLDVPPSYREITAATFEGVGRSRRAVGRLIMFDGAGARVEVWQAGGCIAHRFTDLPGGDVSYEDGAWRRVAQQPDLFHADGEASR